MIRPVAPRRPALELRAARGQTQECKDIVDVLATDVTPAATVSAIRLATVSSISLWACGMLK